MLYTLDKNANPILCRDFREWAAFMQPRGRVLAERRVDGTIFAVIFTGYSYEQPPRVFEYVIYGGDLDGQRMLFLTLQDAIAALEKDRNAAKQIYDNAKSLRQRIRNGHVPKSESEFE